MLRRATTWLVVGWTIGWLAVTSAGGAPETSPDFTGTWRLDRARSDAPPRMEAMRARPRGRMGGGEGPRGGIPGGAGMRSGARTAGRGGPPTAPLPEVLHVTQTSTIVSLEDSTGAVLQEITTVPAEDDTFLHAPGALRLAGRWEGRRLEVARPGREGASIVETWSLEDGGRTLVIRTRFPSPVGNRELKRAYVRADGAPE